MSRSVVSVCVVSHNYILYRQRKCRHILRPFLPRVWFQTTHFPIAYLPMWNFQKRMEWKIMEWSYCSHSSWAWAHFHGNVMYNNMTSCLNSSNSTPMCSELLQINPQMSHAANSPHWIQWWRRTAVQQDQEARCPASRPVCVGTLDSEITDQLDQRQSSARTSWTVRPGRECSSWYSCPSKQHWLGASWRIGLSNPRWGQCSFHFNTAWRVIIEWISQFLLSFHFKIRNISVTS